MRLRARIVAVLGSVVVLGVTAGSAFADLPPAVTINAPSAVSYTSAHVSGTVNPEGGPSPVNWHFEYSSEPGNESAWNYGALANGEISGVEAEGATPIAVEGNLEGIEEVAGLAPGAEYSVRLVAENAFGANRVVSEEPNPSFTTKSVGPAAVSIAAPSSVTGSSAHFSGEINPEAPAGNPQAFDVNWRFECIPECPGLSAAIIPADNVGHSVEVDATGLLYNTEYEVKLIATNAGGEASVSQTFKTEAVAPEVESHPVGTFSSSTAILGGLVDPNGSATSYWIEYATNKAFAGAVSIPATKDAAAGAGQTPVIASRVVTGLEPNSSYFFRITAESTVTTVVSAVQSFHTRASESPQACSNEQLRSENNSTRLPDCRAYELASPDLGHADLGSEPAGSTSADGETLMYETKDAPEHANSASLANFTRATRDPVNGWSGASLSPKLPAPITSYFGLNSYSVSSDFSSTFVTTDEPLSGGGVPPGSNAYVGRADGTFRLVTRVGTPFNQFKTYSYTIPVGGTPNFSHVYFEPAVPQLEADPLPSYNTYSWSEEKGVHLLGILPDETPAPNGAVLAGHGLPAMSPDGKYVAFSTEGQLYLRIDEAKTVRVDASQRTVNPDPNPAGATLSVGITADSREVLFTSPSELTDDANTGESGGVATDAGRDLYSYDIATGVLTDLTADTNPADAATGANVRLEQNGVMAIPTASGSYIYFLATGALAEGAVPGHQSLYVWHEGHIDFVADAENLYATGRAIPFNITPDGQHVTFTSYDSLTGYDNTDPVTGQPHSEVFEATLGRGIECASCRTDGTRPTGGSNVPLVAGQNRVLSDDGSRVFFDSTDRLVPQASSGLQQVFEYSGGKISAISPVDGPPRSASNVSATFFDASASGNDVFFATFAEPVPHTNGGDEEVYDARVNGGFPVPSRQECSGAACRGPQISAPVFGVPSSNSFSGAGNVAAPVPAHTKSKRLTRAQKLARALKACRSKHKRKKRSSCEKKARRTYGRSR